MTADQFAELIKVLGQINENLACIGAILIMLGIGIWTRH